MKANPELYHQHRAAENERNKKKHRETRGDEAVLHNRELQKIHLQKYRERLKEKDQLDQRPKTPQTRKKLSTVRRKNKERKQLQKKNMSRNKKSAINKKRRDAAKRPKKTASVKGQCTTTALPQPNTTTSSQPSTSSGSAALRTASCRFRKRFPSSLPTAPPTRAHVIAAGLQAVSPTTKKAVNSKLGIVSPKSKRRLDLDSQVNMSLKDQLKM